MEQGTAAGTGRIEALSDGVFAVALTILTFDVVAAVRDTTEGEELTRHLLDSWPTYAAYLVGFLTILVCWINHQRVFHYVTRSDARLVWINGLQLALVAVVPAPTAILAQHPSGAGLRTATIVDGITFFLMAFSFWGLWRYVSGRLDRVHESDLGRVRRDVQARTEPDLDDGAGETRTRAVTEPLHVGAAAHPVDDTREDLLAVDAHGTGSCPSSRRSAPPAPTTPYDGDVTTAPPDAGRSRTIEVFTDVWCPFAHVGLRCVVAAREAAGRPDVVIRVRAWPLELVNRAPMDPARAAHHAHDLQEQVAPHLFTHLDLDHFPTSTLEALALTEAAYRVDAALGERMSLAVREELFEHGRDISDPAVLASLAAAIGTPLPEDRDRTAVLNDWHDGQRRGVIGSPHFYCGSRDLFCPSLDITRDDHGVTIRLDTGVLDAFLTDCFEG